MSTDLDSINYQPLEAMKHTIVGAFRASLRTKYGLTISVFLVVMGLVGIITLNVIFFVLAIIIFSAYLAVYTNKYKNDIWLAFATANNWTIDVITSVIVVLPPSVRFGHSEIFSPIIAANVGNLHFDLLSYSCVTGSGKNSTSHSFTTARIELPMQLPHIVLRTRDNEADTQNDLQQGVSITLEGDFSSYFDLVVEKGQELEALAVMSPDVMRTVMDYGKSENIEIVGNQLYFIVRGDKRDAASVKQLIQSVVELSNELIENAQLAGKTNRATVATNTEVSINDDSIITNARWGWSRFMSTKPSKMEGLLIFIIFAMIIGLILWLLIAAAHAPQYN